MRKLRLNVHINPLTEDLCWRTGPGALSRRGRCCFGELELRVRVCIGVDAGILGFRRTPARPPVITWPESVPMLPRPCKKVLCAEACVRKACEGKESQKNSRGQR